MASKRLELHDFLAKLLGMRFFSCVTCVTSNPRSAEGALLKYKSHPCFVVYEESGSCNEQVLFRALHQHDLQPEITTIRVRGGNSSNEDLETEARQLFQVVKYYKHLGSRNA